MLERVTVTTGSRLHFGLLSSARFGGVGVMVGDPGFDVVAQPEDADHVEVTDPAADSKERAETAGRVQRFLSAYRACEARGRPKPCRIEIRRVIPSHAGLGSGTQLGLAVAKACAVLAGDDADAVTLARRVGRGLRSALGIHGFEQGGFLIESGKPAPEEIGVLAARAPVPDEWRFLLVRPKNSRGLSGKAELDALASLPPMELHITERLCRIALLDLLPAVQCCDAKRFGESLDEFGRTVGGYFSLVQGGLLADPSMRELAAYLRRAGVAGAAQTSWGPTLAVFCRTPAEAEELARSLSSEDRWSRCEFRIAAPLNTGATVE